jgi:hypothetical protein
MMINPLTYGLSGLRRAMYLGDSRVSAASSAGGSLPSLGISFAISVLFAVAMFALASAVASRRERPEA